MDKRLKVTIYNADGSVSQVLYGLSEEERLRAHLDGVCDRYCGYCEEEALAFHPYSEVDWAYFVGKDFA